MHAIARRAGFGACLATGVLVTLAAQDGPTRITGNDLLNGLKNPQRWLTFSGDYAAQRHSPLTQITPQNVKRLQAQWTFQAETMALNRGFEATPLAVDGVLYVTGSNNYAWALDGRTGRASWKVPTGSCRAISRTAHQRRSTAASASSATVCSWSRSTRTCSPWTAGPVRSCGT